MRHQGLLAAYGRIVAVANAGHIDVYDAGEVVEMTSVLGAGTCKFRFISSFSVSDIQASVDISSVCFLRGGLLAVAGLCTRGVG
jgi:hypothetical protein